MSEKTIRKESIKIDEKLKELVITRIETVPSNFKLSLGSKGTFTKEEMIKHVKAEDEVGKQIINMQFNFIKALTSGELMKAVTSV